MGSPISLLFLRGAAPPSGLSNTWLSQSRIAASEFHHEFSKYATGEPSGA